MDADAEALTCRSAQRTLYWEWNSRPRAAESLPGSPANLQAARATNALFMMGQNAHSVKVVGFRIKSSQPAITAPFCRCTLRFSVRVRYLGGLRITGSSVKIDFSS